MLVEKAISTPSNVASMPCGYVKIMLEIVGIGAVLGISSQ
jgi:hypothetical protein